MLDIDVRAAAGAFALDVAFVAPSPGTLAVFGDSGAGKTTLLNALAGLIKPTSGRIAIDEITFFSSSEQIDLPIEQRGLGYVFQEGRLFPHLSVAQNLDYGANRSAGRGVQAFNKLRREEVIALLALDGLLDRKTPTLSGGERQRVAIGRALLAKPRLLLLDEPLAALDRPRRLEIMSYIERLRRATQIPIVLVSHAIDEVARLADYMVVLDQGRVSIAGPTTQVMTSPALLLAIGEQDASSIIDGVVSEVLDEDGLALIRFAGGVLKIARRGRTTGELVRIRVLAGDVALALAVPEQISISNVIAATVIRIDEQGDYLTRVVLDLNGCPLIASITRDSVRRLGLAVGFRVFALIKSIALIESNQVT